MAYLTDTVGLPEKTIAFLRDDAPVQLLCIDASHPPLSSDSTPNHNDIPTALKCIEQVGAQRSVLTHLGHDADAWIMDTQVQWPAGVSVAMDNQLIML